LLLLRLVERLHGHAALDRRAHRLDDGLDVYGRHVRRLLRGRVAQMLQVLQVLLHHLRLELLVELRVRRKLRHRRLGRHALVRRHPGGSVAWRGGARHRRAEARGRARGGGHGALRAGAVASLHADVF